MLIKSWNECYVMNEDKLCTQIAHSRHEYIARLFHSMDDAWVWQCFPYDSEALVCLYVCVCVGWENSKFTLFLVSKMFVAMKVIFGFALASKTYGRGHITRVGYSASFYNVCVFSPVCVCSHNVVVVVNVIVAWSFIFETAAEVLFCCSLSRHSIRGRGWQALQEKQKKINVCFHEQHAFEPISCIPEFFFWLVESCSPK